MNTTPTAATATTKPPRGVSGRQRDLFLTLNEEQRRTYRYHFDKCGRLAAHCYLIATGEWDPNAPTTTN